MSDVCYLQKQSKKKHKQVAEHRDWIEGGWTGWRTKGYLNGGQVEQHSSVFHCSIYYFRFRPVRWQLDTFRQVAGFLEHPGHRIPLQSNWHRKIFWTIEEIQNCLEIGLWRVYLLPRARWRGRVKRVQWMENVKETVYVLKI